MAPTPVFAKPRSAYTRSLISSHCRCAGASRISQRVVSRGSKTSLTIRIAGLSHMYSARSLRRRNGEFWSRYSMKERNFDQVTVIAPHMMSISRASLSSCRTQRRRQYARAQSPLMAKLQEALLSRLILCRASVSFAIAMLLSPYDGPSHTTTRAADEYIDAMSFTWCFRSRSSSWLTQTASIQSQPDCVVGILTYWWRRRQRFLRTNQS
jgi:hypothetical protein